MKANRSKPSRKVRPSINRPRRLGWTNDGGGRIEHLESRSLLSGDPIASWHNPRNRYDVNGDLSISALDALIIVNDLNSHGSRALTPSAAPIAQGYLPQGYAGSFYLDVSGDGQIGPLDALQVINSLNSATGNELVRIRMQTTDLAGNPIASIPAGSDFYLETRVQDIRPNGDNDGVFAAFTDVTYPAAVAVVTPPVEFGQFYTNAPNQNTATPGLIDETGALSNTLTPLGPNEQLLWRVHVRANLPGSVDFTPDPADVRPSHDVLVYGSNVPIDPSEIDYSPTSILVTAAVPLATASITDVTVTEGNAGLVNAVFTVSVSNTSQSATVVFQTQNGTALAGSDYNSRTGTLTFAAGGPLTQLVTVPVRGDTVVEADENFFVNLVDPHNVTLLDGQGLGTIIDDDATGPRLSINDVTLVETNSGQTNAIFTVSLVSGVTGQQVTVGYSTSDNSALAGQDYISRSGVLTFVAPGNTTQQITVPVVGDQVFEADESFFVNLSSAVNATIVDAQGIGTILNDDIPPTISISDASIVEGNVGPRAMVFNVTLSTTSGQPVSVVFTSNNGTAIAPGDYAAVAGTLTFAPGVTSLPITVQVNGDTLNEDNETFTINLSNPIGATLLDGVGAGLINDDDAQPTLTTSDTSVIEGDLVGGNPEIVNAVFTVSLSTPSGKTILIPFATADDTTVGATPATVGSDYQAQSGTITIAPGASSATVTIATLGDSVDEPNETFLVRYGNPTNSTFLPGEETAIGTIVDNEGAPTLNVGDVTVTEGNSGTVNAVFTVVLSPTSGQTVTVSYQTVNGTATSPSDYTPTGGILTFAPNETSKTVTVQVNGDTQLEGLETFQLVLSGVTNAAIGDGTGVASIVDDDGSPSLSISDATVNEGTGTPANMLFTVTLLPSTAQTVRVNFATSNASAIAGQDYTASSGVLTFTPGSTQRVITIAVAGDTLTEGNETFFVNLSNPFPADVQLADAQGVGTILDDEVPLNLSIDDVTVREGEIGGTTAVFTVTMSGVSTIPVTVGFATANGTATAGSDYAAQTGILTFAAGETTKQITVPVFGDSVDEGDETFFVNLSSAFGATVVDAQGIGTITDDEGLSVSDATVVEGDLGEFVNAVFAVDLTSAITGPVTVQYSTADGTATAGFDYAAQSGTLTFNPGTNRLFVTVPVVGDADVELSESFFLNLSSPAGVDGVVGQGVGTILDNDSAIPAQVQIRLDVTDTLGQSVQVLNNGDQFFLIAYVQDVRAVPDGVLAAYLDIFYNSAIASPTGPIVYGPNYQNVKSGDTSVPGLIDEVGAFDGLIPLGPAEQELFRIPMQAISNGVLTFDADPADVHPDHEVLVYNSDEPIPPNEVDYQDITVSVGENFFAINDVAQLEGDSGQTSFVFTVTRTLPSVDVATVVFSTTPGTATEGVDYLPTSGVLTFGPDNSPQSITVQVVGDTLNEANETFFLRLTSANGASIGDSAGTGTIQNDDGAPTVSISDAVATEGNTAEFTVTLSAASGQTISMDFTTGPPASGIPATAGSDYTSTSGRLTFLPGETQKTISVTTLTDLVDPEPDETFGVTLSLSPIAQIVDGQALGTIQNVAPSQISGFVYVDVNNNGIRESGEQGIQGVFVTATRTDVGASFTQTIVSSADGSYRFLGLPAGTYQVRETQPGFFFDGIDTIGTPPSGTVSNDLFSGITLTPGNDVYRNYNFGERGLRPEFAGPFINRRAFFASSIMTGIYGPSLATENMDLRNGDHFVSFDGGWLGAKSIVALFDGALGNVTLTLYELKNEKLTVVATSAPDTNRAEITYVGNGTSTYILKISGTNFDVDLRIFETLSVTNVSVNEGNLGTTSAVFTVSMTGAATQPVTVQYATANGTAVSINLPGIPADYTSTAGTLTFAPGTTTQLVTVNVNGDTFDEQNETFFLNLSLPNNVSIFDNQGVATIIDDDITPSLTIGDVTVTEGDTGFVNAVFTLSLSAPSGQSATVRYITSDGTATSPADYTSLTGIATFAAGTITQLITVQVLGDTINELNETFSLNLTSPTNLNLADPQGVATIIDTDPVRQLIIGDVTVAETNTGTTNAVFNVGLSQASTINTTVVYSTANGTALAGSDYVATSGTLTFLPGEVLKQITVPVNGDTLNEANETFFVNLANAVGGSIVDAQGVATIVDNDPIISLAVGDTSLVEGSGTLRNMVFVVDLSVAQTQPVTVRFATSNGTAMGGVDYTIRSGTVTFSPGQTAQTVTVPVIGDNVDENDETLFLTLSAPSGAILADSQAVGTIIDDDPLLIGSPMTEPVSSTASSSAGAALGAMALSTASPTSAATSNFAFDGSSGFVATTSLASPQPKSVDAALTDEDWLADLQF